jgi:uncharacterized protein
MSKPEDSPLLELGQVLLGREPHQVAPQKFSYLLLGAIAFAAIGLSIYGWQQSVLFLIGILLGVTLYHGSFGFASAYRAMFTVGDVSGVLAQVLMLALATILFAPILISGSIFGESVIGATAPLGIQNVVGAFLFGIGMQLGSGCACGTLYTIGGGSISMVTTLFTFCLGSFIATLVEELWVGLPAADEIVLSSSFGYFGVALQLAVLALIGLGLWKWGKAKSIGILPSWRSLIYGQWSLLSAGIALAVLNFATLIIAGRPWGVTWGFTLWTAKIFSLFGWNPNSSHYWRSGFAKTALEKSIFADITSVMNFGLIIGAALAAGLAGKFMLKRPISKMAISSALTGGLLMGFGARMAYGCNVGAYFSGIASTSLHGWLWIICALIGSVVGIKLRSLWSHIDLSVRVPK